MKILYTSENKIFSYGESDRSLTEIPCGKIVKYRETVRSIQQRKEWKTSGAGANFMGMASADMIDPDELPSTLVTSAFPFIVVEGRVARTTTSPSSTAEGESLIVPI